MSGTRLKVTVKSAVGADVSLMTAEHWDYMRQGPTIGPFMLGEGCVYFWPGKPGVGEPVPIGVGQSLVVTCEIVP